MSASAAKKTKSLAALGSEPAAQSTSAQAKRKSPFKIKDLPGLSAQAAHTHTYASIAKRIADSGERTNTQLRELLHETARGQAPDAQALAGIAANYHNLGNFVEALSNSSPEKSTYHDA